MPVGQVSDTAGQWASLIKSGDGQRTPELYEECVERDNPATKAVPRSRKSYMRFVWPDKGPGRHGSPPAVGLVLRRYRTGFLR